MLFTPESIRHKRARIARECDAGAISEGEAGARLIEVDPDFGGGYILRGNGFSQAGDLAGAESCYWKALDRMPCDYMTYMALSDARRRQAGDDPLSRRLLRLAIWKLALYEKVPEEAVRHFREHMKGAAFDFNDPVTFEALAITLEREAPSESCDRLRPFELLNDLQRQAAGGMDAGLLQDILSDPGPLIPLWRAALRDWAERRSALPLDAVSLMIALLGETAGPEILEDLLELIDFSDRPVFLHANWAVWRLGQRFPAEALDRFRAAGAGARATLRCALAEQIDLLPETPGIEAALTSLLEGFAGFAQEDDAPWLLATIMEALNELGRADEAERVFREFHHLLSKEAREWVRKKSDEGLASMLENEEIAGITIEEICLNRILMEDEDEEEDEDDEEEVITPVAAPPRPGRNDPCWCGSGKKYKKCHLAADEESERPNSARATKGRAAESLDERLHHDLIEHCAEWRSKADFARAFLLYWGRLPEDPDQLEGELLGGFLEWYVHDFRPASTGRTLVEEYLRRRTGRLTAAERELVESWRDARFGVWEVQRVDEGSGVELQDLFAGDRFFVHDVNCSRSLVRWDCVLGRIYRSQGRWYLTGVGISLPRPLLPRFREQIERESREAGQDAAAFVRANSHRWHRVIEELIREQWDGLRVVNAEGDELEFCTADYRIEDEAPLIAALEAAKPFEAEGKDDPGARSFAWLEPGSEGPRRSYGHIEVRNGRLRLECNSRKRLQTGRQLIEELGGAWLRHLGDSFESLDAIKRRLLDREEPRGAAQKKALPPEVERELVSKMKSEHYAHWIDERLPALGGQTPRQAARSKAGRRALEDLLRMMENGEERDRLEGRAAFDFSAIRKDLGM